jgi:hypothetical protein
MDTGEERAVYRGNIPLQLTPGESGAMWTEPRAFPDHNLNLYYARTADGAVFCLGEIAENEAIRWSAEFKGALYWFVTHTQDGINLANVPDQLMSVHLGRSDQQIVAQVSLRNSTAAASFNLFTWHNSLYCLISQESTSTDRGSTYLFRVRVGRTNPFEIVQKLPPGLRVAGIDGGYLYFDVSEHQNSLIARLTGDTLDGPLVVVLSRVRLPD